MFEVELSPRSVDDLRELVGEERWAEVLETWVPLAAALAGRRVWHVNATATGGGVAEILLAVLPLWRDLGVDARWLVLDGDPGFFAVTKRIHNLLHGSPGDGLGLDDLSAAAFDRVSAANLTDLQSRVAPGDIVILHDPQTAGLVSGAEALGAHVVWRSHIGRDVLDEHCLEGWGFLEPYLREADEIVVSRRQYAPPSVAQEDVTVITPCTDAFMPKNVEIPDPAAVLRRAGLMAGADPGPLRFGRRDESSGTVAPQPRALVAGGLVPADARVVLQVSRWDRLKDMPGVMAGFVDHVTAPDAHLMLCGPAVEGVTDDPEGAEVLAECLAVFETLPATVQDRVHLVALPMDDVDLNGYLVNALQRHAAVVVQKSLVEGFGLTVTEAMWKGRPVVASAVGGIQDQITDGVDGVLLADPQDTDALGEALVRLLADPAGADLLGRRAHTTVKARFLADTHLLAYGQVMQRLLSDEDESAA